MNDRPEPTEAALRFVEAEFPEAGVALVAGSFLRGQATFTSDLDIVIVTERDDAPFRASYHAYGWPIEAFVHSSDSWRWYFFTDVQGGRVPFPSMCVEGVVIRDRDGWAEQIKQEARSLIARGPDALAPVAIEDLRYILTDALDDFMGAPSLEEGIFAAMQVAERSVQLQLRLAGCWIGVGKWIPRALREADPAAADALREAMEAYCQTGEKLRLTEFARQSLDLAGGRLFEGYVRRGLRTPPDGM